MKVLAGSGPSERDILRARFPFVDAGLRDTEDRAVDEQDPFEIWE
jgi:hypothetical protein